MSNLLKSKFFLGVMMVVAFAFVAGSSASAAYMHTVTLKQGSSGSQVMELQKALGVGADGAFGPMTKAAVMSFQSANGLTADGVVGPMTGAKLAGGSMGGSYPAGCMSSSGYSTTTGMSCASMSGSYPAGCMSTSGYSSTTGAKCSGGSTSGTFSGEGSVKDFSVGSAEESDISEGQSDVELVSFDVELEDDGSLKLDRFDLYMGELETGVHSSKPWDYFESVTVMADGEEIASMDVDSASDWSEYDAGTLGTTAQEYRLRFTGLDALLPSDDTTAISVAFSAVSNLDSADEGATWQFGTETDSFRFEDATGFIFTDGEDLADSFTFDTALEGDLDLSSSSDDPDASVLEVDDSSDTNGATIGVFEVEENEGLDVNITEMTVTLATSDTITDVVKKLYVYDGSTLVGSETVTGLTVTFDNIDLDISGDETVELTIKADLDDTNDQVRYQNGDTIQVASVNLTEYEDEMGNDDGDFTETGSFAGQVHTLYSDGINVEIVGSPTTDVTSVDGATNDVVQFTWVAEVTAFGDSDVYINRDVANIVLAAGKAATDTDVEYIVEYSTGAVLLAQGGTMVCTSDCSNVSNVAGDDTAYGTNYNGKLFFKLLKGKSATFTITVSGTNQTNSKQVRALLNDIEWTTDNIEAATAENGSTQDINSFTTGLGVDAATPFKVIN